MLESCPPSKLKSPPVLGTSLLCISAVLPRPVSLYAGVTFVGKQPTILRDDNTLRLFFFYTVHAKNSVEMFRLTDRAGGLEVPECLHGSRFLWDVGKVALFQLFLGPAFWALHSTLPSEITVASLRDTVINFPGLIIFIKF